MVIGIAVVKTGFGMVAGVVAAFVDVVLVSVVTRSVILVTSLTTDVVVVIITGSGVVVVGSGDVVVGIDAVVVTIGGSVTKPVDVTGRT